MAEGRILARVRKLTESLDLSSPDTDQQLTANDQLELLVALATTPYEEIIRVGRSFEVHTVADVAAVVAVPTTAALLQIWNGEPDNGRSLIVDRVWALMGAGTAAAGQAALIGALAQTKVAQPASAALAKNALNGNGGSDTKMVVSTAALDAITGVAANWRVLPGQTGGQKPGAAATPGVYINAEINGRIIIPPGRCFGIHVFADVVGSTFRVGIETHERKLLIG